ncbi:MAG: porin [Alphaproteobacteria bacterium]|nr:porin [Alphaproteobacteria bacterium]
MRKILLATTALVAFAGAAQAAESPVQVTLGGSVDFRAALFHEADHTSMNARRGGDFQTEYDLTVAAEGKAAGGIEYGALIDLNNDRNNVTGNEVAMEQAYVWMSGAFGKVLMGDEHGASDLFVYAPTVGEGQIDGSYTNFVDSTTLAPFQPVYVDATENSTKATYYTPKVGNANHKVQLGVSYAPSDDQGSATSLYKADNNYNDAIEAVAQYTGTFSPVSVVVSPMFATAEGVDNGVNENRSYSVWGLGAQAMYAGFTLGASYVDAGHFGTLKDAGQTQDQDVWNVGLKYEFDKVAVAANYMNGEGYYGLSDYAGTSATTYVDNFSALGMGATYTWFPGLTTAADAVFFDQNRQDDATNNIGHVLMLSQKMAF